MKVPEVVFTAFHEAGHAVAARDLRLSIPKYVTIIPRTGDLGHCRSDDVVWRRLGIRRALAERVPIGCDMTLDEWRARCRATSESHVVADLAGLAAEFRRRRWTRLMAGFAIGKAFTDRPQQPEGSDLRLAMDEIALWEQEPKAQRRWLLDGAWNAAWRLVGKSWADVERLAATLLDQRVLEGDRLDELLFPSEVAS